MATTTDAQTYQGTVPPQAIRFPRQAIIASAAASLAVVGALIGAGDIFGNDVPDVPQGAIDGLNNSLLGRSGLESAVRGYSQDRIDDVTNPIEKLGSLIEGFFRGIGNAFNGVADFVVGGTPPDILAALDPCTVMVDPQNIANTLAQIDNPEVRALLSDPQKLAALMDDAKNYVKVGEDFLFFPREGNIIYFDQSDFLALPQAQKELILNQFGEAVKPEHDFGPLAGNAIVGGAAGAGIATLLTKDDEKVATQSVPQTPYKNIPTLPTTLVDNITYEQGLAMNPYMGRAY